MTLQARFLAREKGFLSPSMARAGCDDDGFRLQIQGRTTAAEMRAYLLLYYWRMCTEINDGLGATDTRSLRIAA